jgi:hypothetical protein
MTLRLQKSAQTSSMGFAMAKLPTTSRTTMTTPTIEELTAAHDNLAAIATAEGSFERLMQEAVLLMLRKMMAG